MSAQKIDASAIRAQLGANTEVDRVAEARGRIYKELLGYVPPRIQARFEITGAIDDRMVALQEEVRTHAMYPKCFDQRTAQLMLFGMLLMDMNDATLIHGLAARRAGATWEELQAVVNLCFLFRGLSAANKGAEFLAKIADAELQVASRERDQ